MRGMMRLAIMGVPGAQQGGGAPVLPVVDGLVLWLDANDLATLYQDSAGTIPATANGDPVGLWADKSGNNLDLVQATADSKPTLQLAQVNGRPVVRLDGADDFMSRATISAINTANNYSVIIAFRFTQITLARLFAQALGSQNRNAINLNASGIRVVTASAIGQHSAGVPFSDTTKPHIIGMLHTAAQPPVGYLDGEIMPSISYDGASIGDGFFLGQDAASVGRYNGCYCEVLVYDHVLPYADRIDVERYLAQKWGVTYGYNGVAATLADMDYIGGYEGGENPIIPRGAFSDTDFYIREIGTVLYDPGDIGREYKMWYTGYNAGRNTDEKIHFAYSSDGVNWTKSASNPVISDRSEDPYVVKHNGTYYLFLEDKEGGATDIKRFESEDGEVWTNGTTVLEPGAGVAWENRDVSSPVVWIEDDTWYMLYEGAGNIRRKWDRAGNVRRRANLDERA